MRQWQIDNKWTRPRKKKGKESRYRETDRKRVVTGWTCVHHSFQRVSYGTRSSSSASTNDCHSCRRWEFRTGHWWGGQVAQDTNLQLTPTCVGEQIRGSLADELQSSWHKPFNWDRVVESYGRHKIQTVVGSRVGLREIPRCHRDHEQMGVNIGHPTNTNSSNAGVMWSKEQ